MDLVELASDQTGGKILFATDDFFQVAECMISASEPVWIEDKYNEYGKWMDGWESRRRRTAGHDWCILKLGLPGEIKHVVFDTAFFTGNQVPRVSIQAARLDSLELARRSEIGTCATPEELEAANAIGSEKWTTILQASELKPGYPETRFNKFEIHSNEIWTHLRINQLPDGGIARFRAFGIVHFDWEKVSSSDILDFASVAHGARALGWSDAHYGSPKNLLLVPRSSSMKDGWETSRNPNRPAVFEYGVDGHLIIPGKHWAIIKLGHKMRVDSVEIDTNHYKGNYPESVLLEGTCTDDYSNAEWTVLVPRTRVKGHSRHLFSKKTLNNSEFIEFEQEFTKDAIKYVRLTMFPDGGISRLRIFGSKVL